MESSSHEAASGVPQEGHISPLLFSLFVNSISLRLTLVKFLLYADHLKIFYTVRSPTDSAQLQNKLHHFTDWITHSELTLNLSRCSVIFFTRSCSPILSSYFLKDVESKLVNSIKGFLIY